MPGEPEVLVLDTGVIGLLRFRRHKPERIAHWPSESVDRMGAAITTMSFVSRAEINAGLLAPEVDPKFAKRERERTAAITVLPLDQPTIDEWARLHAHLRAKGVEISDNDLWIAATASSRSHPVVTCDGDLTRLADQLEVIHLPPKPDSGPPPGP